MEDFTWVNALFTVVVTLIASSGFWALVEYKIKTRDSNDKRRQMQTDLLIGLAHDRIVYLGMKYIERGSITNDEYENLNLYLYKPYVAIGGNGSANRIMAEIDSLPIVPASYDRKLKSLKE